MNSSPTAMVASEDGENKKDEVITVSNTAIPTVSAIVSAGAKPVFVDIGDDYLPPSNAAPVEIGINENSILRLHEINLEEKIVFEPPVCTHVDCLEE